MNVFLFTDTRICQPRTTHLVEKSPDGLAIFCTKKPQTMKTFALQKVYRINKVTGIYRLSNRELHICYNIQVLSDMTNQAQLSGGKYYELVN